jgi:hypothetical protein
VLHFERFVADLHRIALLQPAIRFEFLGLPETETACLRWQLLDPVAVAFMRAFDRQFETPGKFCRRTGVIDVRMSQQDLCQLYPVLLHAGEDFLQVTARIDDRAVHGFSAPDDRAVLLERGDRNDEYLQAHERLPSPPGWSARGCTRIGA